MQQHREPGGDAGWNNQKIPLRVFPAEWRGWSSALSWPLAPKASRDNASPCPLAGGQRRALPRGLRTPTPRKVPLFSPQRTPRDAWAGGIKWIFFSADRNCLEASNGFQNSREEYGSQLTGLINNICLPARRGEGEDLPEQELCSHWEHLFQTFKSHFPMSPAAFGDVLAR